MEIIIQNKNYFEIIKVQSGQVKDAIKSRNNDFSQKDLEVTFTALPIRMKSKSKKPIKPRKYCETLLNIKITGKSQFFSARKNRPICLKQ
jgi:hypothetical protein